MLRRGGHAVVSVLQAGQPGAAAQLDRLAAERARRPSAARRSQHCQPRHAHGGWGLAGATGRTAEAAAIGGAGGLGRRAAADVRRQTSGPHG